MSTNKFVRFGRSKSVLIVSVSGIEKRPATSRTLRHWELLRGGMQTSLTFTGFQRNPYRRDVRLIQHTMARTAASTTATQFDGTQRVRQANAQIIKRLNGVAFDRLEVRKDLVGTWEGADPAKAYAGLVPYVGGQARFDLAILSGDLMSADIPSFPDGDKVVGFTPDDDLHKEARAYLVQQGDNATYDGWLNHLAALFAAGGTISAQTYWARTKKGGRWENAILGLNKKA